MTLRILTILLTSFLASSTWAYVPPYAMILARTADLHGKGAYVIEQDVIYKTNTEQQSLHETWTVLDENHLKVNFEGIGPLKSAIKGSFIYDSSQKFANEPGQPLKTRRPGEDFIEQFLHFRSSKNIRPHFVQLHMAPPESLRDGAQLKSEGPLDYAPESYVQLARLKGEIVWAICRSPEIEMHPAAFIEQDEFLIKRLRLLSHNTVDFEDYVKYEGGFFYPKQILYKWKDRTVTVQTKSVRHLGNTIKAKELFNTRAVPATQFIGGDILKDFYLRFR
jgi:hypothetical protein